MAGVSGPMLLDRQRGVRFLTGLAAGELAGGLVVGSAAYVFGTMIAAVAALPARLVLVGVAGVMLAIADLMGKTPQVRRQVPQRLVRSGLSPALLGAVWGFDLGLLFTTRKAASLGWLALVAVALLQPPLAPALTTVMASATVVAITIWSVAIGRQPGGRWQRAWQRAHFAWLWGVRSLSATVILAATATVALEAVGAWTP